MARKVFDNLDAKSSDSEVKPPAPASLRRQPLVKGGAAAPRYIERSTQSASDRTHEDIPTDQIQDSIIEDRIDVSEGLDELVDSIRKNGQQIPIIVRIVNKDRPFEIVAGRRRLAAIRKLGNKTIRGYVTRMDDREAFIAQGIENSARLETSFIERARAVVSAEKAGFTQGDLAEFISVSQTLISFMTSIYEWFGEQLVLAIGPARGVGRRKWEALMGQMKSKGLAPEDVIPLIDHSLGSAERFEALLIAVNSQADPDAKPKRKPAKPSKTMSFLGGKYAVTRKNNQLIISAKPDASHDFLNFINDRLAVLIDEYTDTHNGKK